jgi:hypothetical protein
MTRLTAGSICGQDDKTGWANCPPPTRDPGWYSISGKWAAEPFHLPAANRGCIGQLGGHFNALPKQVPSPPGDPLEPLPPLNVPLWCIFYFLV